MSVTYYLDSPATTPGQMTTALEDRPMTELSIPEWLLPGAKVVTYSHGRLRRAETVRITTVKKIATKSFSLDHEHEPRYDIRTMTSIGGALWDAPRIVVPLDSDKAREILEAQRTLRLLRTAENAVDEWRGHHSLETKLAAIAALQAVED